MPWTYVYLRAIDAGDGLTIRIEDFALLEASYVVICLLQAFPNMRLPEDEPLEPIGAERQKLTLVLSSADGCRVVLRDHQIPQNNQKL